MKQLFLFLALFLIGFSHGQVKIGSNPTIINATSLLELESISQGFLPPRMTEAQRIAIVNPAKGLMIYCINCGTTGGEPQYFNGTAWVNFTGGPSSSSVQPVVGQLFQGGIVAYIYAPGESGYVDGQTHGIIAAISDQSTEMFWHNDFRIITGALGLALGTGLANTNAIIINQGPIAGSNFTNYAAGCAKEYIGGGYTDWYLPSINELAKLYELKVLGLGRFSNLPYWSSTEFNLLNAYAIDFNNGIVLNNYEKYQFIHVRAVRSF